MFLSKIQYFLKVPWKGVDPGVPYEVICACGQVVKGLRKSRHQVVPCPGCGQGVFVLPFSPLPPVAQADKQIKGTQSATKPRALPPWKKPVVAAAITLAAMILILLITLSSKRATSSLPGPKAISQRMTAGKKFLSQGKFHEAVKELEEALALRACYPEFLSASERKDLTQLHRQASLLADLLSQSLEEILFQASAEADEQEWQALFADRYKGKAIVFFAEVRRDVQANYLLDYDFFVGEKRAHVELGNIQMLRTLPMDRPQRLLFGARLASVGPEAGGTWVIRFEPDSGVLLTDPGAVAACYSRPLEGLDEVLQRQAAWIAELP
jgi:hypothetical protein